jgi:hypothetical protein
MNEHMLNYWIFQINRSTYTDLSSYRKFFVTAPMLWLYNSAGKSSICISPSAGSVSSGSSSAFSEVFLAEEVDGLETEGHKIQKRLIDTLAGLFEKCP